MEQEKDDIIYESMLKSVFQEYCDLCMSYLPDNKIKLLQEIGRTKAHTQKKRAKSTIQKLPKTKRLVFLNGCYDELGIQLLRQLKREVSEADYDKCDRFLSEIIEIEKKKISSWIKEFNRDEREETNG